MSNNTNTRQKGKTTELEQRIFTFRVGQLTQLIWLVFSILEVLIALRIGLKFVWAIQKVRSLLFDRGHEPLANVAHIMTSAPPPEVIVEKNTSHLASHQQDKYATRPKSILAGLLFGGLAGIAATLLLTPQSGKKMRTQIQQKGMELSDQASEIVENAVSKVYLDASQLTRDVRKQAGELKLRSQTILDGKHGALGQ